MPGVPVTFIDEEDEYLVTGTHKGASGTLTLVDRSKDFRVCGGIVGNVIKNDTDDSAGVITAITEHTVTCTLSDGSNNTWSSGDTYYILKTDTEDSVISTHWTDRLFGRKVSKKSELNEDGRFHEDADLDDKEWSPGYPIRERF